MPTYNGHKNWQYWNVSLWINNDESLYSMALEQMRRTTNKTLAAERMLEKLKAAGITKTPDGAAYSVPTIRAVMRGM